MAKLEKTITGNFNEILHRIEDGIINGSVSASLEESSDFSIGDKSLSLKSGFLCSGVKKEMV